MKKYKKPIINIISLKTSGFLCGSGIVYNQKTYNCPIKPWVKCDKYNAAMQDLKRAIKYAAENKLNRTFVTTSDEMSCPHKSCIIFMQWQKQQKTK